MNEQDIARFMAKVDRSGGPDACHPWTAAVNRDGYGILGVGRRYKTAHRVAFFVKHGRWAEPCCCHICDMRACCNDRHLFEGTHQDNMTDRNAKGRQARQGGESHGTAKLTESEARRLIALRGTMTTIAAGELFGLSNQQVSKIWTGKRWARLQEESP